jgi:2-polyprenyl-6-hydroxyphenyl methylase/3-demethylubiquinone-9 3-methyltransferase
VLAHAQPEAASGVELRSGHADVPPAQIDMPAALACYRDQSRFVRAFVWTRHMLAPLERVALEVPSHGRILDLGCGHGLFTNLLAAGSRSRQLLGVDPSPAKIAVARRSSAGLANVRYFQGHIDDVEEDEDDFQAITILDVLYLLPDAQALSVLRRCRQLLAPQGVLLVKTNDTRPLWKYAVVRAEEELMVRVLGFTHGGQLHFRGANAYVALLRQAGFEARMRDLDCWLPVPHRLFVCRPA